MKIKKEYTFLFCIKQRPLTPKMVGRLAQGKNGGEREENPDGKSWRFAHPDRTSQKYNK